jgi:hypothetical protein
VNTCGAFDQGQSQPRSPPRSASLRCWVGFIMNSNLSLILEKSSGSADPTPPCGSAPAFDGTTFRGGTGAIIRGSMGSIIRARCRATWRMHNRHVLAVRVTGWFGNAPGDRRKQGCGGV